jgi:hypothetical protein
MCVGLIEQFIFYFLERLELDLIAIVNATQLVVPIRQLRDRLTTHVQINHVVTIYTLALHECIKHLRCHVVFSNYYATMLAHKNAVLWKGRICVETAAGVCFGSESIQKGCFSTSSC